MRTHLHLQNTHRYDIPPEYRADDVRMADELVEFLLREFTKEGDCVLDPFAGFGTTLYLAEAMGRDGYGIEYTRAKADFIRSRLAHPERLIHGDSRQLASYDLPAFDFCLTSPPYTPREDTENPFTDYSEQGFSYAAYLQELRHIYEQVAQLLKPSAHAVIEIANLKTRQGVTPLAWDVAREISQVLTFEGEIVVCWDQYGFGYDHSYCLVFSKGNVPDAKANSAIP
ncbi:MAG: DNA methyltransferase [Chloroflexota bacterium]